MKNKAKARVIWKPKGGVKNYIYKNNDDSLVVRTLFLDDLSKGDKGDKVLTVKFNKILTERIGLFSKETVEAMKYVIDSDLNGTYTINKVKNE